LRGQRRGERRANAGMAATKLTTGVWMIERRRYGGGVWAYVLLAGRRDLYLPVALRYLQTGSLPMCLYSAGTVASMRVCHVRACDWLCAAARMVKRGTCMCRKWHARRQQRIIIVRHGGVSRRRHFLGTRSPVRRILWRGSWRGVTCNGGVGSKAARALKKMGIHGRRPGVALWVPSMLR